MAVFRGGQTIETVTDLDMDHMMVGAYSRSLEGVFGADVRGVGG